MRTGIIYKATSPSCRVYVGQTLQSFSRRKTEHYRDAFNERCGMYSSKFHRAIRKYVNDFRWEILYKNIPEDLLDIAEMCAIYIYDSYYGGYNCTFGGDGAKGRVWTDLQREERSRSLKSVLNPMYGKIGANFGKKFSDETKRKMSESWRNRRLSSCQLLNLEKWRNKKFVYKVKEPSGKIIDIIGIDNLKKYLISEKVSFYSMLKYRHSKKYEILECAKER
jgi:hypothetical protein